MAGHNGWPKKLLLNQISFLASQNIGKKVNLSLFNFLFVNLILLRSTLGERFVIFGDPVVDGIPVHARREDSRFLVTWTGDVQNLRHFE